MLNHALIDEFHTQIIDVSVFDATLLHLFLDCLKIGSEFWLGMDFPLNFPVEDDKAFIFLAHGFCL